MANLYDFWFTGDDPGPDTDPFPDSFLYEGYAVDDPLTEDDRLNFQEPGYGETFGGGDPTVFQSTGDPDEPDVQEDAAIIPAIETEEQTATIPDEKDVGWRDDPESREAVGDEAEGDDEDDGPPDPAQIDAGADTDSSDEVQYPEQGQDTDNLTVRTPERGGVFAFQRPEVRPGSKYDPLAAQRTEGLLDELVAVAEDPELNQIAQELLDWQAAQMEQLKQELFDYAIKLLDAGFIFEGPETGMDPFEVDPTVSLDAEIVEAEAMVMDEFGLGVEENGPEPLDLIDALDAPDDLFTSDSALMDFGDVLGGVNLDTLLVEFGFLNQEDV